VASKLTIDHEVQELGGVNTALPRSSSTFKYSPRAGEA